jgi:hypothetical protein
MDACMWDPDAADKDHRIVVAARAGAGGGVVFEVSDNGMGIAEENQAKVLATSFTTKGIRGTGLGLLLTKKAVAEHGGAMGFESTPGEGTSFRIELPAALEAAGDGQEAGEAEAGAAGEAPEPPGGGTGAAAEEGVDGGDRPAPPST